MNEILIGSANPYKQRKIADIVRDFYTPTTLPLEPVEEVGETFKEIAENKAKEYSRKYGCIAISTDGGAVIPALGAWEPVRTRRFGDTDEERIFGLLKMMEGVEERTLEWYEALAVADKGELLFSVQERAMDANVSHSFDPKNYQEGIWVCSVIEYPQFGGKNYFELTREEQIQTEDSWTKLAEHFRGFAKT